VATATNSRAVPTLRAPPPTASVTPATLPVRPSSPVTAMHRPCFNNSNRGPWDMATAVTNSNSILATRVMDRLGPATRSLERCTNTCRQWTDERELKIIQDFFKTFSFKCT